jgi:flagellar biosynthesis chaperone FliJ
MERLRGSVREGQENLKRVEQMIGNTARKIGNFRQELAEYHWLRQREQRTRARLDYLKDRINHLRMYEVEGVPDPAPLDVSAPMAP